MRSRGQIEADVAAALSQFERDHMGRGPRSARAHLIGEVVAVRLGGILSVAEQTLSREPGGVELIKQLRTRLIEAARPRLDELVTDATGVDVVSMHSDLSTRTGERVFLFILEREPDMR